MMHVSTILLPLLVLATACEDTTPARIEFAAPSHDIHSQQWVPLTPNVVNREGNALAEHSVSVSAIPTDVVEANGGRIRCLKSGDATVNLTGGGVSGNTTIKCRIVAEIRASKSKLSLTLGTDPEELSVAALDADGNVMEDVSVKARVQDQMIAGVSNGTIAAKGVGKTTMTLTAGEATAEILIEVIEKVTADSLALSDGESVTYTLNRGHFQVEVNVRSGSSDHGVTAAWVGEACSGHAESQNFVTRCRVNDTASIVVENPTTFGMGPSALGNVAIYRVP